MKDYQRRRDSVDIGRRGSGAGNGHIFYGMEGDLLQREGFAHYIPSDYDHGVYESGKHRQSLGGLVRKLNCAAPKKQDYDVYHKADDYGDANSITDPGNHQLNQSFSPYGKERPQHEITRPVLITVNNGDSNEQTLLSDMDFANFEHFDKILSQNNQLRGTFGAGELPPPSKMCTRTPSFKLGMSARKRQQNASKYFQHDGNGGNGHGWPGNNKLYDVEESQRRRAAQEAARRERWKRGLEMENRMIKGGAKTWSKSSAARYRYQDDNSSTDSLTEGSHTAGTSITGSEDSSTTDWTYSSDVYHYHGQCADSTQIVASVAEDVGTIAKFILADGVACLGTAAKITQETAASCKGPEPSPQPRIVRRPERRRWGRKRS